MADETVLIRPIVTEKTARLAQMNQYVFQIGLDANKIQVAEAVERIFKVKVTGVRVMNREGKRKRRGAHWYRRQATKRAIVTLAKGQTIDTAALA
jgi:large subunit ribosomal protein L23